MAQNATVTAKGQTIVVTLDTSKPLGPSASGKNTLYAMLNETIAVNGKIFRLQGNLYAK